MNVNSNVDPCTDIQQDSIVSNIGPRVVPDTELSVRSRETPNFDPDHHLETSPIPYNGRNYFSLDIASSVHVSFTSSILTSIIQRLFQF